MYRVAAEISGKMCSSVIWT